MFEAVAEAAARWRSEDLPSRRAAVETTLKAPNRFTREALTFAIEQQMEGLSAPALRSWIGAPVRAARCTVGVLSAGNVPMVGLQDLLAVTLSGHRFLGSVSRKSPALLRAFATDAGLDVTFVDAHMLFECADAVITTGSDRTRTWAAAMARQHGIALGRCLLRGHRFSAAVVDGQEDAHERHCLAMDALLHEGMGCRSVALILAPIGVNQGPYVASMKRLRSAFPAHPVTSRALGAPHALLEALAVPHSGSAKCGFLVSCGEATAQGPAHIRWVSYDDWQHAMRMLSTMQDRLQRTFVRRGLIDQVPPTLPAEPLGQAQRPALDWKADHTDTLAFLRAL